MRKAFVSILIAPACFFCLFSCAKEEVPQDELDTEAAISYCKTKLLQTVKNYDEGQRLPRIIRNDSEHWEGSSINSWTSGFYPGLLWTMYDITGEKEWYQNASYYTGLLEPVRHLPWKTHDFGFMMFYSFGKGFEITGNELYKKILIETADSLASLFNPEIGTIESWPWMRRKRGWPHTTIIDNMMNLELLFWAAQNGGGIQFKQIAENHALKTMEDFVRPDYSTIQIVVYDSIPPRIIKKTNERGYNENSTWARGQAWAIYGFTKAYAYIGNPRFLKTAQGLADYYIENLPEDFVPYWDFNLPDISNEPRDASAAAITASALLRLSELSKEKEYIDRYLHVAYRTLERLSSDRYLAHNSDAFLKNSVGNKPANSEVSVSLIYTDYFYLEALIKMKEIKQIHLSY